MGTAVPDALIAVDAVVFRILKPINMGWPDGEALVQMQTVQRLVASLNCCWFTPQQSPSLYFALLSFVSNSSHVNELQQQ